MGEYRFRPASRAQLHHCSNATLVRSAVRLGPMLLVHYRQVSRFGDSPAAPHESSPHSACLDGPGHGTLPATCRRPLCHYASCWRNLYVEISGKNAYSFRCQQKRHRVMVAQVIDLYGVTDGARTHDNRNHNPGLYQLSYSHRRGNGNYRAPACSGRPQGRGVCCSAQSLLPMPSSMSRPWNTLNRSRYRASVAMM